MGLGAGRIGKNGEPDAGAYVYVYVRVYRVYRVLLLCVYVRVCVCHECYDDKTSQSRNADTNSYKKAEHAAPFFAPKMRNDFGIAGMCSAGAASAKLRVEKKH